MKVLTVANQKGGVGKTSILFHLAMHFAKLGKRTLVVDLDPQANATKTLRIAIDQADGVKEIAVESEHLLTTHVPHEPFRTDSATFGPFLCPSTLPLYDVESVADLQEMCRKFHHNTETIRKNGTPPFDYCLIDSGPAMTGKMAAALVASDFVVSPVEMELYSLDGLNMMIHTIENYQKANKKLKFLGMIPNKVRQKHHSDTIEKLTRQYPNLIIPCPIGYRDSIAEAVTRGIPAWKIKKTAARAAGKEMTALGNHILKLMEAPNGKK